MQLHRHLIGKRLRTRLPGHAASSDKFRRVAWSAGRRACRTTTASGFFSETLKLSKELSGKNSDSAGDSGPLVASKTRIAEEINVQNSSGWGR